MTLDLSWNKCAKICRRQKQDEAIASSCLILATPLALSVITTAFSQIATGNVAQEMNQKRFRGERNGRAHRGRHKVHSFTSSLIRISSWRHVLRRLNFFTGYLGFSRSVVTFPESRSTEQDRVMAKSAEPGREKMGRGEGVWKGMQGWIRPPPERTTITFGPVTFGPVTLRTSDPSDQ